MRELAGAFDTMLDRLEGAFARQRSFTADASHELRTPLTVVRGQLGVLARQPNVTRADVLRVERVVDNEVQRMERLVDDLLLLAHSEQDVGARHQEIDVPQFLTELFDGLTLTAQRRFELAELPPAA